MPTDQQAVAPYLTRRGRRLCALPRDGRGNTWSLCTLPHGHDGDHHIDWALIRDMLADGEYEREAPGTGR